MMLLDTDVLIDVALDRHPHSEPASELLERIEHGAESAYIAWHTVSNLYYIVAPSRGGVSTRDFIVELTRFVAVATTDTEAVRWAAELPVADFEDATADRCGPRLRRSAHRDEERQGLRTVSNTRGQPAGGAQRIVLERWRPAR